MSIGIHLEEVHSTYMQHTPFILDNLLVKVFTLFFEVRVERLFQIQHAKPEMTKEH